MKRVTTNRWLITVVILAGLLLGAVFAGVIAFNGSPVLAQSADDEVGEADDVVGDDADDGAEGPDVPITGPALEQASDAALDHIGEGRVTETEVGDEEGYYEVEITLDNGRQVDVHLDKAFNVLGSESD